MISRLFSTKNPIVFLQISANRLDLGIITIELRSDIVPKTSENFRQLCVGRRDLVIQGSYLTYKNSSFHRVIPKFMCQGGDITNGNGTGGLSIYGLRFPDENFKLKHDQAGLLGMANSGPDTNNSQFYITFAACPWLDGKYTVFGKVTEGLEVLKKIEKLGTCSGTTRKFIKIINCGEIVKP